MDCDIRFATLRCGRASMQARRTYLITAAAITMCAAGAAAQDASYTFTSGPTGDGFNWPPSPTGLLDGDYFDAPEVLGGTNTFYNYIGNNLFFDDNYQVAGNSSVISDEACWGNPTYDGCCLDFDFYNSNVGFAQTIQFSIAWSLAGDHAPEEVYIYVEDQDGDWYEEYLILNSTFPGFGGFDGREGTFFLQASDLLDDQLVPLDGIVYFYIDIYPVATKGATGEFAIDNFIVDGSGSGGENSDVTPDPPGLFGVYTNTVKQSGFATLGFDVINSGSGSTTYSVAVSGANWMDEGLTNVPIDAGATEIYGAYASIDRNLPSGSYPGQLTLSNDLNPSDLNEDVQIELAIYDPVDLTDDSGTPVDPSVDDQIFISNAAVLPHAGAIRADAEVLGSSTTGAFNVTGFVTGAFVNPGEIEFATVALLRYGLLSGIHNGTHQVDLEMASEADGYLNGDPPVPPIIWNIAATLADTTFDSASIANGGDYGPNVVGVNTDQVSGTILDGTTTSAHDVAMSIVSPPLFEGSSTETIGESVEVLMTDGPDQYVLQVTYRESDLCIDISETDLRLLWFDTGESDWTLAVDGNTDGGSGESFFAGSYDGYVAGLGGGSPALSVHGLDVNANTVWAVIDHASIFGAGKVGANCAPCPADSTGDGTVNVTDLLALLANWGPCIGCAEDTNGDDVVNVSDLLALLAAWGPCVP